MSQVPISEEFLGEIEDWLLAEGPEEDSGPPEALRPDVLRSGVCPQRLAAELTDEALAVAVRRGWLRREMCSELARRYGDRLRWWLLGFGADHALADDLSQALLLQCLQGLRTYRPSRASFSSYLGRMAHNAYLSSCRGRRPQGLELVEERPTAEAGPEEAALMRELTDRVEQALQALEESVGVVMRLTMQGASIEEIARQTGAEARIVYRQRFRGRRALEKCLGIGPEGAEPALE